MCLFVICCTETSWLPTKPILGAGYRSQWEKGYVSWQGWNLFLTPAHDWIHKCIQDCTRKWDPALNRSRVRPNRHQGIIAMLIGGRVG